MGAQRARINLSRPDSRRSGRGFHELIAPDIFVIEVAHAIAKAERRSTIKAGEGTPKLADVLAYLPALHSFLPLIPQAFDLATTARISVYDCLYVALAEREGCDLLTADERLVRALPGSPIVPLSTI